MDFTGLVGKFPINRPLTDADRQYQLRQHIRLDIETHDQHAVIRLNSTFLETVDKWYAWKGFTTAFAITLLLLFVPGYSMAAFEDLLKLLDIASTELDTQSLIMSLLFMGTFAGLICWGMLTLLRKESFFCTHYPIRYNRKTGMVHYFRPDGEIRSVPWRDVFFTVVSGSNLWGIRGHILADDKLTVVDTFGVGDAGSIRSHVADPATGQYEYADRVRAHWEFIRRYMEEGPAEASQLVRFCVPVSDRKETRAAAFHRAFATFGVSFNIFHIVMAPFCFWLFLGRLIAIATSKIPQWPAEINAACAIEPNDPYAIRGNAQSEPIPDKAPA